MTSAPYLPPTGNSVSSSIEWINDLLLGSLAFGLCVIAVAVVGLLMFSGRLPVRQGLRVILGCFILLGAPIIAAGFLGVWQGVDAPTYEPPSLVEHAGQREEPPPADYDPYAGASLRRD